MRRSRTLDSLIAALVLMVAARAQAGVNSWTLHGPAGGGGATIAVAVHPTNANIVLTSTQTGVFRSTNGGQSWVLTKDNTFNSVADIAFDPSRPDRVMLSDGILYVSEDAGQTFAVAQGPSAQQSVNRIEFGTDGTLYATQWNGRLFKSAAPFSTWTEITGLPWAAATNAYPDMLAVDPEDSQVVYVAIQSAGLYRSDNGGADWTAPLNSGVITPATFSHLAFDPADSTRLLLATGGGIYLSTTSGASWTQKDYPGAFWVGFDPTTPGSVAAVRYGEIAISSDNGDTWTAGAELDSPGAGSAAFASGVAGRLLISTQRGLLVSTDSGATATYRLAGLTGVPPRDLAASDDGTVLAAMSSAGADLFRRAGSAYEPLDPDALQAALATNFRQISSIAMAAGDSRQIFAINNGTQFVRSFNGGASWTAPHAVFVLGNPADYLTDVEIDPSDAKVAYVARAISGIWKTTNSGATFTQLANSPPYVFRVGISPHDGSRLYASGGAPNGGGIYTSTDGGASWTEQVAPTGGNPANFSFHPTDPNTVYASNWSRVFKTTNGGTSWTPLQFPPPGDSYAIASAVLIDPLIPSTMVVVGLSNGPGIFRSVDAGITWEQAPLTLPSNTQFYGAVLDPMNPSNVIAATNSAGIAEYQVSPDLALAVSGVGSALPTSGNANAIFAITNRGPHASSASELVITLPAWVTANVPSNCSVTGQTLRCEVGVLRVDESINVPVTLSAPATPSTGGRIEAVLSGHETDLSAGDNSIVLDVDAAELADVDVAISSTALAIDVQQSTAVTVTVSNAGPSPSTANQLQVQLPANMTATAVVAAQGSCTASTTALSCNLGNLANGASATVTFTLTGNTAGTGTLQASVEGAGTDTDGAHSASRDIVTRSPAPPPTAPGGGGGAGGGGGGGGSFDLLLAGLLGLLVALRSRGRPSA